MHYAKLGLYEKISAPAAPKALGMPKITHGIEWMLGGMCT